MSNPVEIKPLFFALIGGSPGAEIVLLNQNLAISSSSVLRDFNEYLLGPLLHRLFDFVHETRDPLRLVEFQDDVLDDVRARWSNAWLPARNVRRAYARPGEPDRRMKGTRVQSLNVGSAWVLAGLKHGGAASLVSKRRGRPSNNRLPEAYRDLALSLVRERYADFGPTLAARSWRRCTAARFRVRRCAAG
jgi:hypothetical protein